MNSIYDEWEFMKKTLTLLENMLGPDCEVVLHDMTKEYSSTIVDIRNGHITNRKVGDSGSNLGLQVLRGTAKNGDDFNYFTYTKDNRILRSSSIYLRNEAGVAIGSICVNLDITDSVKYEEYLHRFNKFTYDAKDNQPVKEVFTSNVRELLEHFMSEAHAMIGKPVGMMTKEDKQKFILFLDEKGAFLITKSGDMVCEFLEISKYTLYRYLENVRDSDSNK